MTSQMMPSTSLSNSNPLPTAQGEWALLVDQAKCFLQSGLLPKTIQRPEQVVLVMLKGRELGIPPLQALSHINVINGKPAMSAELMLAQILRLHPKTQFKFLERSNRKCVMSVKRAGFDFETFEFSIEDAELAGLMANPSWKKYPRAMLHARVVSEMARSLFPDAIAGISYTPEELGAHVDENGDILEINPPSNDEPKEPVQHIVEAAKQIETPKKPEIKKEPEKTPAIFRKSNPDMVDVAKRTLGKALSPSDLDRALVLLDGKPWLKESVVTVLDAIRLEKEVYEEFL